MFGIENRRLTRRAVALARLATIISTFAPAAQAQDAKPPAVPSIEQRVDAIVTELEARRKELGVPGAAIVIAHRDRIVRTARGES